MKSRRINIKEILKDKTLYKELIVNSIIFIQNVEGILTTREQAEMAFEKIRTLEKNV